MKGDVGDVSHVQGTRETCRSRNSRFRSRSVLKQFEAEKRRWITDTICLPFLLIFAVVSYEL